MEQTPHDPRYDDIEVAVEDLFNRMDKIYNAFMEIVLNSTHEIENSP